MLAGRDKASPSCQSRRTILVYVSISRNLQLITQEKILPLTRQLPVMEAFYSIQGEGFHQGKAAYFIRLGGCDVGCVWCDVKDSWDEFMHPHQSVSIIVGNALEHPGRLAIVT